MKIEIDRIVSPDNTSIQIFYNDGSITKKDKRSIEYKEYIKKEDKRNQILQIASLSDQLNLLAEVLNTLTSPTPDKLIIQNAKEKFGQIKAILNSK